MIAKRLFAVCLILCSFIQVSATVRPQPLPYNAPPLPNYSELVALAEKNSIDEPLKLKLDSLLNTPFVSNEAYYRGARPHRPDIVGLGASLRVVSWNIERGENIDKIIRLLTDKESFLKDADKKRMKQFDIDDRELLEQIEIIQSADVFVLQELDWGVARTGYREIVKELGAALNMNWAYGVEFVEIDPLYKNSAPTVDKERFKGLHGNAVLSRYPIIDARLTPLRVQGYNWYSEEKKRVTVLEKGRRLTTKVLFQERAGREIRRGGRTLLTVTLDVPDLPEGRVVVASVHLENRCKPSVRKEQMKEVLSYLYEADCPVILAGDFNTSHRDARPMSYQREIYNRIKSKDYWLKQGIKNITGIGMALDMVAGGVNYVRSHRDPTVKHIPVFAPNNERALFRKLEKFRFKDGHAFDFRGDARNTINELDGTLANSNERAPKGFVPTYEFERAIGPVGKFKLDWIFVKSYAAAARDKKGSYRFAPHFARTLKAVNYCNDERLSDHTPISVDLPFNHRDTE